MNKEFVTYEHALALKELGFDEPCFGYFNNTKIKGWLFDFGPTLDVETLIFAPTHSQAFRWFREKYNLNGLIFTYSKVWKWKIDLIGISCEDYSTEIDFIPTYEEAEQACLDKLIEICKNK